MSNTTTRMILTNTRPSNSVESQTMLNFTQSSDKTILSIVPALGQVGYIVLNHVWSPRTSKDGIIRFSLHQNYASDHISSITPSPDAAAQMEPFERRIKDWVTARGKKAKNYTPPPDAGADCIVM